MIHCPTCTCWIETVIQVGNLPWRMKQYRHKRHVTQSEAARLIGVQITVWQRWEYGQVKPSTAENLVKLQRLLQDE